MLQNKHNHEWKASVDQNLFHPDCDPRILAETCPACREYMALWAMHIQKLVDENR